MRARNIRALRDLVAELEATGDNELAERAARVLNSLLHESDRLDDEDRS